MTRRATVVDVDAVIANLRAGFESYATFVPAEWQPPQIASDRAQIAELLDDPETWALLALADGLPVGHVAFTRGRERLPAGSHADWRSRPVVPGLAHLSHLFVLPEWWGRGVAPLLHDAALAEMGARGYRRTRLVTPTGHRRARRFYERRGWVAAGEEWNDELALDLTEHGLAIAPRA